MTRFIELNVSQTCWSKEKKGLPHFGTLSFFAGFLLVEFCIKIVTGSSNYYLKSLCRKLIRCTRLDFFQSQKTDFNLLNGLFLNRMNCITCPSSTFCYGYNPFLFTSAPKRLVYIPLKSQDTTRGF